MTLVVCSYSYSPLKFELRFTKNVCRSRNTDLEVDRYKQLRKSYSESKYHQRMES